MKIVRKVSNRLKALFLNGKAESELDDEMQFHLEMEIEKNLERGMSPFEARRSARVSFGGMEQAKEDCRDAWGIRFLQDSYRNLRFGLRLCSRYLNTSILAVVVLSMGIGIASMMYTMSSKLLDTSSGADLDDRQLYIQWELGTAQGEPFSSHDFKVLRSEVDSLEDLAGIQNSGFWFSLPLKKDEGKQYKGVKVTANFFELVNAKPILGNSFSDQDAQSYEAREIVISDLVWADFFDRDKAVLEAEVMLNGDQCKIAGVMPTGFAFPRDQQIWMATDWREFDGKPRASAPKIGVTGKLKPGLGLDQARAELETIASNLAVAYPETNEERTRVRLTPYREQFVDDDAKAILYLGLFGSLLVLTFLSTNVFQIIMGRTAIRSHELAVRRSLGAKRSHVIWQVVVDGLALSGMGAIFGIGFAALGLRVISDQLSVFEMPWLHDFQLTPGVFLFAIGAALFAGIGSSIIPAWRASRMNSFSILKDDSRSSSSIYIGWLSKAMITFQVLFSSILLFLSVMLLWPSLFMDSLEMPYDKNTVLTAGMQLGADPQFEEPRDVERLYPRLKQKLMATPGVRAVALGSGKFGIMGDLRGIEIEGEEEDKGSSMRISQISTATPDFLDVYGLKPLSGRMINAFDSEESLTVCVVNSHFVDTHCKNVDPIGLRLKIEQGSNGYSEWITIVGVIPSLMPNLPGTKEEIDRLFSQILLPFAQHPLWNPTILLSAQNADNDRYRLAIRESVKELAPLVRFQGPILTIGEGLSFVSRMIDTISLGGKFLGGAILVISIIGLYSIIAFTTNQRRKEFGIRIAVGSNAWGVMKSVMRPWALTIGSGLILGFISVLSLLVGLHSFSVSNGGMEEDLRGYTPIFLTVAAIVGLATLIAMIIPARRAAKINPMDIIRAE